MTTTPTPLVIEHSRSADAIAVLLDRRLEAAHFGPPGSDPLRDALVRVGARYCELLTERLNAVPELHHQAFLSRLGGDPAPALPATVLLTFKPVAAPGAIQPAIVVPAFTPVGAAPAAGDPEPVVFETLADLAVVRARLARAIAVDADRMASADVDDLLGVGHDGADLLVDAAPIEQVLCIAAPSLFAIPRLSQVRVDVKVDAGARHVPGMSVEWGLLSKDGFVALAVESDSTEQLSRSGTVVLTPPPRWPSQAANGIESMWLCCRPGPVFGQVPADAPAPLRIGGLRLGASAQTDGEAIAAASFGGMPLDASKDFYPFGERPRFGDVFQVACPLFAQAGAHVDIDIRMTNPAGAASGPIPPVNVDGRPRLKWEIHTRGGWIALDAADGTRSLTQNGQVGFTIPPDVDSPAIGGIREPWVRARLVSGQYGLPQTIDGVPYPAAPSIASISVHWRIDTAPTAPERILRRGAFEWTSVDPAAEAFFAPFPPFDVEGVALLVALVSDERTLKGRTLSVQVQPGRAPGRSIWREAEVRPDAKAPRWQLMTVEGWKDCAVSDDSAGLTRSGIVQLRIDDAPTAWAGSTIDPAQQFLWLRVVWPAGGDTPRLRRIALNAVRARQSLRLANEVLGSSNGRPGQIFQALRTPIVDEVVLQVREPSPDGDADTEAPADANVPVSDASRWVRWQRVDSLSDSAGHARDFTLDRFTGRVAFGDGRCGRIPPAGANNIRLREYHAGGGVRGNSPAAAVSQLRTTVPYVEAVTNLEPASGGQDGGDALAVRRAGSAWLRHRERAVCGDDYADLALAASTEVARAYCSGTRDLAAQGLDFESAPGWSSVTIVPHGDEPRPQPSLDLLGRVQAHLDARKPVTARLRTLGPDYLGVSVSARISCAPSASPHELTAECRRQMLAFLHPVNGGIGGRGWAAGARPHRSDFVALLGAIEGVDHVEEVRLQFEDVEPAARRHALVCAGAVEVLA